MGRQYDVVMVGSLFVEVTPVTPGESLATARQYSLVAGGAAANVVFALARLGVGVHFITAVGDDEFGTLVTEELASFGIPATGVRRMPGQLTPVSFCAVDGRGGKTFRTYRFSGACSPMEGLGAEDFAPVRQCRLFDFSESSLREPALRPVVLRAAAEARAAGAIILYAANLRRGSWKLPDDAIRAIECAAVAHADIVMLNAEEATFITGHSDEEAVCRLQELGPRVVIMTRGGDGDMLIRVGDDRATIAPYRVPVIYDVGAGDTFHAGLVSAMIRYTIADMTVGEWVAATRFGAAVAAIRVSTSYDPHDLPTTAQVAAWMASRVEQVDTR